MCIYAHNVCNGYSDCTDGSDEDFSIGGPCHVSEQTKCRDDEFKCSHGNNLCIPNEYVCDGDLDCFLDDNGDESDELGCFSNATSSLSGGGDGVVSCETDGSNFNLKF